MLSTLKPMTEKVLTPVAKLLGHVPPNLLTLLGVIFPIIFFVLVVKGLYWWALLALVCNVADMLDGLVARAQNKVTAFGGFLDSTVDRFADFTILAAFSFGNIVSWNLVAPLLLFTYLISYIRSRTELAAKGKLVASVGLVERTERLILVFVGIALYAWWPHSTFGGHNLLTITAAILLGLSVITVGQRVAFAYRHL